MIDVFESQATLDAFGATLMPRPQELAIQAKPTVLEVHNTLRAIDPHTALASAPYGGQTRCKDR